MYRQSRFITSENVCMPTGNRFSLFISMLVFAAFRAYSPAKLRFYSETGKENGEKCKFGGMEPSERNNGYNHIADKINNLSAKRLITPSTMKPTGIGKDDREKQSGDKHPSANIGRKTLVPRNK